MGEIGALPGPDAEAAADEAARDEADGPSGEIKVFQNLMVRSAVPPPLARRPRWCGLHAIALTAA